MEGIVGSNLLLNYDHEPLVTGGDSRSVNFLTFTLLLSAYRPVPLMPCFVVLGIAGEAEDAFVNLGPIARVCLNFVEDPEQAVPYKRSRQTALDGLSLRQLTQAVKDSGDLECSESYFLFLIRQREDIEPDDPRFLQEPVVEPITPHIKAELKFKLREAELEARLQVYRLFETVPASR